MVVSRTSVWQCLRRKSKIGSRLEHHSGFLRGRKAGSNEAKREDAMSRVVSLILGGGRGSRLYPLTKSRSKPAVPIAGKYRLIDIPISNCIHSGLNRIFVLTQFNSVSLHRHIASTYTFDPFGGGFVEILAAQQTMQHETWYQGTADAVRRNLHYAIEGDNDLVLILSGDQLYRMDFLEMITEHIEAKADASIATLPVPEKEATACGIMKIDASGSVTDFLEKPNTQDALARVRTEPEWMLRHGVEARGRPYLASMGIYLFNRSTLDELLDTDAADFGKEVFPRAIRSHRVHAHLFDGYWEDIGTIGAFHKANLDLTKSNPPFEFATSDQTVYTRPRYLPCSRVSGATITDSLISDGCVIGRGCVIENSVIGVRAHIAENTTVRNSYVMGADTYERPAQLEANVRAGIPHVGIAADCVIENAIIDKNARIGQGVRIVNEAGIVDSEEAPHFVIRDGVVVVPKFTILREKTMI
jgi:glucose-1-phosphate adenylyltransferase